jgi:hypothetical protein
MIFSGQPFSTQPFSTSGRERRYYVDMSIGLEASFDFKIYIASTAGFATLPTDNLANQPFRGVLESYSFDRDILNSEIGGFIRGHGSLVFMNTDTYYDFLPRDYSIEAQPVVLRAALRDGSYNLAFPFGRLTATGWTIDTDRVTVDLVDDSYKLEVPLQLNLYAGTGGAEGGEELANKPKPLVFGFAREIKPVFLDRAVALAFQVNDGPVQSIVGVRVRGVPIIKGPDYPSYAALNAASIPAGQFATCLAGGYMRLGFLASDEFDYVTADVQGDNRDGYVTTHADVIRWAIRNRTALVDPDDIDVISFNETNAQQPAAIDYWLGPDDSITVADFIANITSSLGGFAGLKRDNRFAVRVFSAPSGSPVMRFTKNDMHDGDIKREPLPDAYRPPPWRWRVPWGRCWTVQTDIAGAAGEAHRAFVAEQYRLAEYSNAAIKVDHPFGKDRDPVQSYFTEQAPALAEAQRRSNLFKTQRAIYQMTVLRRALRADIGHVIFVEHPRFDLSLGRPMRIVSIGDDVQLGANKNVFVRIAAYG